MLDVGDATFLRMRKEGDGHWHVSACASLHHVGHRLAGVSSVASVLHPSLRCYNTAEGAVDRPKHSLQSGETAAVTREDVVINIVSSILVRINLRPNVEDKRRERQTGPEGKINILISS